MRDIRYAEIETYQRFCTKLSVSIFRGNTKLFHLNFPRDIDTFLPGNEPIRFLFEKALVLNQKIYNLGMNELLMMSPENGVDGKLHLGNVYEIVKFMRDEK